MINITEAYVTYYRYWLSRKFLDIFGFGYLTNTLRLINSVVKFDDLGDIKKIAWSYVLIDRADQESNELKKKFDERLKNVPKYVNVSLNEAIAEVSLGLSQRIHHFKLCSEMLQKFNEITKLSIIDNIYGLSEMAGIYVPNFFEDTLIKKFDQSPARYENFKEIFLDCINDEIIENEKVKFDFIESECSI